VALFSIAPGLHIPPAFAGRSAFVTGTKGSGKTYTAGVIAEELLESEFHVVVLDPTGVWWGLRHGPADANNAAAGFPIAILGGSHADVPLEPTAGEAVADWLVRSGQSCVLDLSGFGSDAEQDRFVEHLLKRLYRQKADRRDNLHLIMDEADLFIPENPMRGQDFLIGATKTIVTKGRSRGLGMTMITQRPQSIKKSAIEEADVIFAHRMQGLRAVKAMQAWTDLYATKEQAAEFFASLPTLADGECWVWSPQFLKCFKRVQIRHKQTFDSSRTPEPGERPRKPRAAAAIDLANLTQEMLKAREEVQANDPKVLRAEINRLKTDLAGVGKKAVAVDPEALRQKEAEAEVVGYNRARKEVEVRLRGAWSEAHLLAGHLGEFIAELEKTPHPQKTKVTFRRREATNVVHPTNGAPSGRVFWSPADPKAPSSNGRLNKIQRTFLTALAQEGRPLSLRQLAVMSGYSAKSTHPGNTVSTMRTAGYVEGGAKEIAITPAGLAALGTYEQLPTGRALLDHWLSKLDSGPAKMLRGDRGRVPERHRPEGRRRAGRTFADEHAPGQLGVDAPHQRPRDGRRQVDPARGPPGRLKGQP
jgi:hypothetical protein